MTSTGTSNTGLTTTSRTGGLWAALALATSDADREAAESRRRLAALQLRIANISLDDYEPCA